MPENTTRRRVWLGPQEVTVPASAEELPREWVPKREYEVLRLRVERLREVVVGTIRECCGTCAPDATKDCDEGLCCYTGLRGRLQTALAATLPEENASAELAVSKP